MTRTEHRNVVAEVLELLIERGFEGMAQAIQILLNEGMKLEREEFLGACLHERTAERRGHANGYKPKKLRSRLGELGLEIPQVRDVLDGESFYPSALERGERSERALKLALAEMYVQGVSTRKVKAITEELCGFEISSTQVSRISKGLDEELEKWRSRPLGENQYLMLDARYEKVRHGGQVISVAVLVAIGIAEGMRSILGVSVSLSEAEVHWREFLYSLRERGLCGLKLVTTDDHPGLKAAMNAVFPAVPWQRCQVHLQRNAAHHAPRLEIRKAIARELRAVFNATNRPEAQRLLEQLVKKYAKTAPDLASRLEENIPESFSVFAVPVPHQRRLRSTNVLERLNKEILRRTRVATLFPNTAALLRLVSAVLVEISEEWETGRRYLPKEED
jgi:transposase-like protein